MCANLIDICTSINMTLYRAEIEAITRFKRKDNRKFL